MLWFCPHSLGLCPLCWREPNQAGPPCFWFWSSAVSTTIVILALFSCFALPQGAKGNSNWNELAWHEVSPQASCLLQVFKRRVRGKLPFLCFFIRWAWSWQSKCWIQHEDHQPGQCQRIAGHELPEPVTVSSEASRLQEFWMWANGQIPKLCGFWFWEFPCQLRLHKVSILAKSHASTLKSLKKKEFLPMHVKHLFCDCHIVHCLFHDYFPWLTLNRTCR